MGSLFTSADGDEITGIPNGAVEFGVQMQMQLFKLDQQFHSLIISFLMWSTIMDFQL